MSSWRSCGGGITDISAVKSHFSASTLIHDLFIHDMAQNSLSCPIGHNAIIVHFPFVNLVCLFEIVKIKGIDLFNALESFNF